MGIIQNHIAGLIHYLGIQLRFDVSTAVCNRSISGVQFEVGNAFCDTAQCKGLLDVRIDLTVDRKMVYQSRKAEMAQIIVSKLGSDLGQRFYCNDIHGIPDAYAEGSQSSVLFSVPITNGSAVRIFKRCVVHDRSQRKSRAVKSGSVGGYYFESRSWLADGIRRVV